MYENLYKNNCFISNETTGFHVNVSFDSSNPIYFSYTLIDTFLKHYRIYENKNYNVFRPKGTIFANPITQYIQEYTYKFIKPFIQINNKDYFYSNFIDGENFYRGFINLSLNKYTSIYLKNPTLLEFRLFPSEDNFDKLLKYIEDVSKIMNKSYSDYIQNINKNSIELQNINIKNIVRYEPLKYYYDYLYFPTEYNLQEINNKDESEIILGIENLLDYHNQKIKKLDMINKKLIVKNLKNGEREEFMINIFEDNKIELIKD